MRRLPEDERTHQSEATMHKSVYRRFEAGPVLIFARMEAYRPVNLQTHIDFRQYFGPGATAVKPAQHPQCVAGDIEMKWANGGYVGRI